MTKNKVCMMLCSLLLLVGCGSTEDNEVVVKEYKEAISSEVFSDIAEDRGFEVIDYTDDAVEAFGEGNVNNTSIAFLDIFDENEELIAAAAIEYYDLISNEEAETYYKFVTDEYTSRYSQLGEEKIIKKTGDNFKSFNIYNEDYWSFISMIDNTIILADLSNVSIDEIESFIEDIGYN